MYPRSYRSDPRSSPERSIQRLLPIAAGYRHRDGGALTGVGAEGGVWCSSTSASGNIYAGFLHFGAGGVSPLYYTSRAYGLSVRCVQHLQSCFRPVRSGKNSPTNGSPGPGVTEATASVRAVG